MDLDIVILAAGKGTRMRSGRAKVLHELAGRPMIEHVMAAAGSLQTRNIAIVVGHQAEQVKAAVPGSVICVDQDQQNGTGHAVQLALNALPGDGVTLVLYADVPLVNVETLQQAVASAKSGSVGLVTADFADPAELGRIVRNQQTEIQCITEFKDADDEVRQITEINSGILAAPTKLLAGWLAKVKSDNAQGEIYLTDVIEMAVSDDIEVQGIIASDPDEVIGVNDRGQLAQLERIFQKRQAQQLMEGGATLADPARVDIRGNLATGTDCFIDVNVVFKGEVTLGNDVSIAPGCVISDATIGNGAQVHANSVIEGAIVADGCSIGPFARLRVGTDLKAGVRIGNFVETKNAQMGEGSKANHLAYLGDTSIGAGCNIGAGTITCNYDGVSKHRTEIGDGVFVGTNSTLVAPISIEDDAFVAAGTTVTVKVRREELAVGRAKQRNISGWVRPDKRDNKD